MSADQCGDVIAVGTIGVVCVRKPGHEGKHAGRYVGESLKKWVKWRSTDE